MTADPGLGMGSVDPPARVDGTGAGTPWLLVVAQGHARLLAELEAMFRDDPRVRVIENRRHSRTLLPRGELLTPAERPIG